MFDSNSTLSDGPAFKWCRRVANTAFVLAVSATAVMIVVPFTGAGVLG